MIILIAGASHTGKTCLAQQLLEKYHYPYLSIDHLKMGLIRAGYTRLTPVDMDEKLTAYLWPIVREMIKTAIENGQNLIAEGCYIPFDWSDSFDASYRSQIRYRCLIMSEAYIRTHFDEIRKHGSDIEDRGTDDDLSMEEMIKENTANLEMCQKYSCPYILIDNTYNEDITKNML